jgi:pyridoxamine 5'-phosphate oxidase
VIHLNKEQKVTLIQLQCRAWDYLRAGADNGRAPFTVMQAATIGRGGAPSVRAVVLRHVREAEHLLDFYTDVRSEKAAEVRADPRIALVGYDPEGMIQLRLSGVASVLADGAEKQQAWDASRSHSLVAYRTPCPPGTFIDSPEDGYPAQSDGHDIRLAGYGNFCIVRVILKTFEVLDLSVSAAHKRACFSRTGDEWTSHWIAP